MNMFVMNQGPGPAVVTDASGLRHDLGEGSSNVFRAPLHIVPFVEGGLETFGATPDVTPDAAVELQTAVTEHEGAEI